MNPFLWYRFSSKSAFLELAYQNNRYFRLFILTTDTNPINIDFGNGIINSIAHSTTTSYDLGSLKTGTVKIYSPLRLKQIGNPSVNVVATNWNFSLGNFLIAKNILQFDFRSGTIFGNTVNLSNTLQTFQILTPSNGSLTGTLQNCPDALLSFNQTSINAQYTHTTVETSSFTPLLTNYVVGGLSKFTGNIVSLAPNIIVISLSNTGAFLHEVTYATTSGTRTWANGMYQVVLKCALTKGLTTAMIDALLIDLSVATWVGGSIGLIRLIEGHGIKSSSASVNSAISLLVSKGVTLTLN